MKSEDKKWIEEQGFAETKRLDAFLELRIKGGFGVDAQSFITEIIDTAFREGLRRGEYKCPKFLRDTAAGFAVVSNADMVYEFRETASVVQNLLDAKYKVAQVHKGEAVKAAEESFG